MLLGVLGLTTLYALCTAPFTTAESATDPANLKFSKLLNEKSEFLRFTSIANTQTSPNFQNVYNRAEDVPSIHPRTPPEVEERQAADVDFPEASLITAPSPDHQFVRIRQGQLTSGEDVDGLLTSINQRPISGRPQVTALRQSSGKRLNITPIYLTAQGKTDTEVAQATGEAQHEVVTQSPMNEDDEGVTTIQYFELSRETTTPDDLETTTTSKPLVSLTTPNPRFGVTIFDNRTNAERIYTTTPMSLDVEDDNFLPDSFHRNGRFPDFEDIPTNLAGAESSQPARVNVRPASTGKDYEYEYIYYYYDDDDDNSTTPKPVPDTTTTKAHLPPLNSHAEAFQSKKLINTPFSQEQSNVLESRNQKSIPDSESELEPEVVSVPNPALPPGLSPVIPENEPVLTKQTNVLQNTYPEHSHSDRKVNKQNQVYPLVPRGRSTPLPPTTQPPPSTPTSTQPPLPLPQDYQNHLRSQLPPANQFQPPVLQFEFVNDAPLPPTSTPPPPPSTAEPRQRGRSPFQRNHLPRNPILQDHPSQNQLSQNHRLQNHLPQNQLPQNQLPQNQLPQNQLPQNHISLNQLPQNQLPQDQLPQNHISQNQLTQNHLPQNPLPRSHLRQNQLPLINFPQNPLPHSQLRQNQLPLNSFSENAVPQSQNHLSQTQFPLNELPNDQPLEVQLPQYPSPPNKLPQEPLPLNQLLQDELPHDEIRQNQLPQSQSPQQEFAETVVKQGNRRPDSSFIQDSPIPRRTSSRRPQNVLINREPQSQQDQPPTTPRHTVPAVLIEDAVNSGRVRFPTRGTSPLPEHFQSSFAPPQEDSTLHIQTPTLEATTTQRRPFDDEEETREHFARQKSVSDLYALSRLHQLAINTKIPDKRFPESTSSHVQRGTPLKNGGGFISSAELTTNYPLDQTQSSESTTITSFGPSHYVTAGDIQKISISTTTTTTTTTTTEEPPLVSPTNEVTVNASPNERPGLKEKGAGRFRGRNRERPITSTTTTTEATPRTFNHNRFAGRRRNSAQPPTSTADIYADVNPSLPPVLSTPQPQQPQPQPQPQQTRVPARNRFGGRTRPTTTTTEVYIVSEQPEIRHPQVRIPNRRPLAGGPLNTRRRLSTSTPPPLDNSFLVETPNLPTPDSPPSGLDLDSEKRPPIRSRSRPNGGLGPIVGRPFRGGRTTPLTTTTTTTEQPEAFVTADETHAPEEVLGTTLIEGNDPVPTQQVQEANAGVITQKISVSSSTTTSESAEPPKRGSAGALGRLRTRTKAIGPIHLPSTTTTLAPEVTTLERKPSRLNGILNRRKATVATTTTTHSPLQQELLDDDREVQLPPSDGIPPNGVIVQVSSVVSETEDSPEHPHEEEYSSTTQGSILHRLKSQRKPGSLFRKRIE